MIQLLLMLEALPFFRLVRLLRPLESSELDIQRPCACGDTLLSPKNVIIAILVFLQKEQ